MRRVALAIIVVLAGRCWGEEAPEERPKDEAARPTITQIVQYPRSVDTMARVWMTIYQACQEAGVPASEVLAHDVSAVAPELEGALPLPGRELGAVIPKDSMVEVIGLEVSVYSWPQFVRALQRTEGRAKLVTVGQSREAWKYAGWQWKGAWASTEQYCEAVWPARPKYGGLGVLRLWVGTRVGELTRDVVALILENDRPEPAPVRRSDTAP